MASISPMIVSRVERGTCLHPKTFLIAVFVSHTSLSQKPPYHGAFVGIKTAKTGLSCLTPPSLLLIPSINNSSAADMYVSGSIIQNHDLWQ